MSEPPFDGFILDTGVKRPDVNAASGFREFLLVAVAQSETQAIKLAKQLGYPRCKVSKSGPEILERARKLKVHDGDVIVLPD